MSKLRIYNFPNDCFRTTIISNLLSRRTKFKILTVYRVCQLGTNEKEAYIKSLWDGGYNDFERLSIQCDQQKDTPVWPTALYPYKLFPAI